jgi:hypothetical protein
MCQLCRLARVNSLFARLSSYQSSAFLRFSLTPSVSYRNSEIFREESDDWQHNQAIVDSDGDHRLARLTDH